MKEPNEEKTMEEKIEIIMMRNLPLDCSFEHREMVAKEITASIHSENQRLLEKIEGEVCNLPWYKIAGDGTTQDLVSKSDTLDIISKYKNLSVKK
jgi:hypothetical protein